MPRSLHVMATRGPASAALARVGVEALARLLAEMARLRRAPRAPAAGACARWPRPSSRTRMIPRHDVEADEVRELERPHRVVEPDPARRHRCPRPSRCPARSARIASARNGIRIRLTMNPGRSAETMTCLPSSPASARTAATGLVGVAWPRMSSTSGMTGTGLKKCIPRNRSRRGSPTASASRWMAIELRVRGEDRVRRRASRSSARHRSLLDARGPRRRPRSTRSASATRARSDVAVSRASVASRSASREPALRDGPVEVAGDPVAAGLGPREVGLVERRPPSRSRHGPARCRGP